ncbi:carboxy terminal-processing peptidase [Psychrobacter sp. HD31]|uniref:carboxy terminal-processing peptidase n=1 Tax=Psychrobacter sp. HD31 TaxID=3112003 RepID=UPI003DA67BD2
MKNQKSQWALSALFVGVTGLLLSQSYNTALAQTTTQAQPAVTTDFMATPAQKLTTRQIAALLDRAHYLSQPLNEEMGRKILDMYFYRLDSNRTLFLQSDIDEFTAKYGASFANRLKRGNLTAGAEIFERYRQRANEYHDFANQFLANEVNLTTNETVVIDREDEARFTTKAEQEDYWRRKLTYQLIGLTLAQEDEKAKEQVFLENPDITRGQDLIRDDQRTPAQILLKRLARKQGQMNRIKDDEIMETLLNTATLTYDPHSNYYAPVQATEIKIQSSLQLEGIGVSIRPDRKNQDYTRIVTLVDGGPAAQSGQIKPNDLIIGVAKDGKEMQDVIGWSTREIVGLIRGKRGTEVVLKVKQPNTPDSAARTVSIVRDVIKQEESGVQHRVIDVEHNGSNKRIGVLEIPSFYLNYLARRSGQEYRSVSEDTQKAINALQAQNIDGMVVDLRNDPGGSLTEVVKMLGMFIKDGPMVQIRDGRGHVDVYQDPDDGEQIYAGDMVVITNLASASASEIFAAAIQDYGRGLVVGSTTTGKGSAQIQLDNLALGSATLTQRKFYRVNGGSTQNKGVVPDVKLVNIYDEEIFGERATKNPLAWDTIESADYTPAGKFTADTLKTLNEQSQIRQTLDPQFVYLSTLNSIREMDDDKKAVMINIDDRRAHNQEVEQKTLEAENKRRIATGKQPYADWHTYQAAIDALFEERSKMKEHERPELPESEAFVLEAAQLMLDAK